MLYDPKWEITAPQKTDDPFDLDRLIAWLERQPSDKQYCYWDNGNCLLANFFKECGPALANGSVGGSSINFYRLGRIQIPGSFHNIAQDPLGNGGKRDWTYGAALKRARAYV